MTPSKSGTIITQDDAIAELLATAKTIVVLGLSPKPERDSHMVARYLQKHGYRIIPVRPGQQELLGEKAFATLDDITEQVDIVDVFRRSDQIMPHAQEALRLKPKAFWMQLNIENQEAANFLTTAGINVVMNMCIKVEHDRLLQKR